MNITERMMEAAEANVRRECEHGVARIRADLREEGEDYCMDCDDPISLERKAALPSAERCVDCQQRYERDVARERIARGL